MFNCLLFTIPFISSSSSIKELYCLSLKEYKYSPTSLFRYFIDSTPLNIELDSLSKKYISLEYLNLGFSSFISKYFNSSTNLVVLSMSPLYKFNAT